MLQLLLWVYKDLSLSYVQNKIFIENLKLEMKSNQEFIY
jgi:hypothetical protein